jgi:hypothetical protein
VEEIAFALWRQQRLRRLEAAALEEEHVTDEPDVRPLPSLTTLARYRARLARDLRLAEEQLAAARQGRFYTIAENEPEEAGDPPTIISASPPKLAMLDGCMVEPEALDRSRPNRHERRRLKALARRTASESLGHDAMVLR